MDFDLSEDSELMRSGLRELLERECGIRHVRALAYDGPFRDDTALWAALAAAGWTAVSAGESAGGMGLPFETVMVVAMEAGRSLLPLPLTTTLLATRAVEAGLDGPALAEVLDGIVSGRLRITLAIGGGSPLAQNDDEAAGCDAVPSGDGWLLRGAIRSVPYGPLAHHMLVEAAVDGQPRLFLVPTAAPGVVWDELSALDPTVPRYDLRLEEAVVPGAALLSAGASVESLRQEWCALLAAETLGASERMVEIAADYAKTRVQFGRPIGSNQAVKIRIAEMATAVERMRVATYYAALCIDERNDDRERACSMAKAMASPLGAMVGTQAIHVHGGIGYTWEHDIHFFVKRVKSNELFLGDGQVHLLRIADLVLEREPTMPATVA